ncbi:hypothetical protein P43SY_002009 [Pythium insidiosum]|uniref:Uncharacterized protein n=1 Tax=Pythium insidiosum TaxID=114742 RepID=A0AAD5LID6_PYTIN|nr:hypothetical protein P43SY_002009 [Pythium insidiosum]KAJ0406481.1 hypothetical protein ATCC90586_000322 [Pythium insidiosum]
MSTGVARKSINIFQALVPTRHYGVGKKATRAIWDRFPEPSYWEITRILPSPDLKHGKVYGRLTFRGKTDPAEKRINGPLKRDWRLVDQA